MSNNNDNGGSDELDDVVDDFVSAVDTESNPIDGDSQTDSSGDGADGGGGGGEFANELEAEAESDSRFAFWTGGRGDHASVDAEAPFADRAEVRARAAAARTADAISTVATGLGLVAVFPLLVVFRVLPSRLGGAVADWFIKAGCALKLKFTSGDVLNWQIYGDKQIVPKANRYSTEDTAYESASGDSFSADSEGHQPYQLYGKFPVVFGFQAASEAFEPVAAYFAMQADRGETQSVAKTDGGKDTVANATPPQGTDGLVLSWEKTYELLVQKIGSDDLDEQYRAGYLEGLDPDSQQSPFLYAMLLGGGVVLGAALIIAFSKLTGGGGGGGAVLALSPLGGVL